MYTNKHAWTNKDGTYKEIYYYVCSRNRMVRGKHCEYKAMLKKTDIEPVSYTHLHPVHSGLFYDPLDYRGFPEP